MKIKNHAIFIADSHYNKKSKNILLSLLKKIDKKEIQCDQLFLMGDIFDFLAGPIAYFKSINHEAINLINEISYHIDVIYLEGNHDFLLKNIFPNSTIFPRELQPLKIIQDNKIIKLAHGDIFTPISYELYTSFIRNKFILKLLNMIDLNYWLTYKVENRLMNKNICQEQKNFKTFIQHRIENYECDLAIEGHYHQGYLSENYINIPSLYCSNKYLKYSNNLFSIHSV